VVAHNKVFIARSSTAHVVEQLANQLASQRPAASVTGCEVR